MANSSKKGASIATPSQRALTKRDLVVSIAETSTCPQQEVQVIVQSVLDGIVEALQAGRHVEFRNFGVFEIITRKPRLGRNPNKPDDTVIIPARKTVRFKPGRAMRQLCTQMKSGAPRAPKKTQKNAK